MLPTLSPKEIEDLHRHLSHHLPEDNPATAQLLSANPIAGGDINHCIHLKTKAGDHFLKLNAAELLPMFEAEADGLNSIGRTNTISAPQPLMVGTWRHFSYLLLPYLSLQPNGNWRSAGQKLAQLHQFNAGTRYGFTSNSFCGPSLQVNDWQTKWPDFFVEQRLRPQLVILAAHPHSRIDSICNDAYQLLEGHHPKPALVHGDLWSGNIGFSDDRATLYDPAIYIGDRETDLAMTELFGGFPQAFYNGYNLQYPTDPDYLQRRPLYQLYHLLNHANLFGGSYLSQAETCIARINRRN